MTPSAQSVPPTGEILIVEDSPTQAQRLKHILDQLGYRVTHATNGRQALEAAQLHKPLLIITDVIMPEMDGYELCRRIKADANLADVPVFLVTSLSDLNDVVHGLECHADNFILKPYDEHSLLSRVQFVLLNRAEGETDPAGPGVEIFFKGQRRVITSGRRQILNLLLSTYDAAIVRNKELDRAQSELRQINSALGAANLQLEKESREREQTTLQLRESNVELERARSLAEKASLAKSEFLSNMSHELRTPLNAILGFAQLLQLASRSPVQQTQIAQILQSGWHLLELINEILDLTVVESGKVPISLKSVALAGVFAECQEMMEPQAQARGIRLSFSPFDLPGFVWADRTRLKQIIINLLSNAIKYNNERGTVVVECSAITPERIRISVRDTGVGLSPENLAQLFQPFNRLGQETSGVSGTGIGLVMTKQLVELMDGTLGVESAVGTGSVFWVELLSTAPDLAAAEAEPAAHVELQLPAGVQPRSLLYIEDNPANMMLIEQLIARRADLKLLTAVNAALGIELARTAQPAVILMDINLPGINGIEALKILRADPATAHIAVVALSSVATPRDVEAGLKAGFSLYLTMPLNLKGFMDTLDHVMEFAEIPAGQRT